jgi:hypothetical protein
MMGMLVMGSTMRPLMLISISNGSLLRNASRRI